MADKKISALTGATTPLAGTEVLPIVQGGATVKVAISDVTAGRAVTMLSNTMVSASAVNDVDKTGGASYAYRVKGNDQGNVRFRFENTGGQIYELVGGNPGASNAGWAVYDATAAATRLYLDSSGNWTVNTGNITQGTAAKGYNFTANTPAAGMTSQLLNWYEEGTWTPQYTHTTPPTTPYTMTITSATYTRVGRMVTVRAFIATSNVNTAGASGALKISGLPFTSASHGVINIGYSANWAVNNPSTGYVESGATTIQLQYRALANGATASLAPSDLTSGASADQNQLIFVAVYFV